MYENLAILAIFAFLYSAIAGRMSAYTGRSMKWEWALKKSELDLTPKEYKFGDLEVDPPAKPGTTKLV